MFSTVCLASARLPAGGRQRRTLPSTCETGIPVFTKALDRLQAGHGLVDAAEDDDLLAVGVHVVLALGDRQAAKPPPTTSRISRTRIEVTTGQRRRPACQVMSSGSKSSVRRRCPLARLGRRPGRDRLRAARGRLRRLGGQQVRAAWPGCRSASGAAVAGAAAPASIVRLARRHRAGHRVHHVGDDAGDVVRAAAADGQVDELQHGLLRVGKLARVLCRVCSVTTSDRPSEHSR